MPIETKPTREGIEFVSVEEAFGLPVSKVGDDPSLHAPETKTEVLPEKTEAEDPTKAAPVEPAKTEESAKPADQKPADPPKPAPAKPAVPAKTEKPEDQKPADPPKPAAPEIKKIKIGEKEFTEAELKERIEAADKEAARRAAEPAPVETQAPTKEPTAEEKAAAEQKVRELDSNWIKDTAPLVDAPLDESTLEKILTGGPDAVKTLQQIRQQDAARAILMTRKLLHSDFRPDIDKLLRFKDELDSERMAQADAREEEIFKSENPDLADHIDIVNAVAHTAVEKYTDQLAGMTMPEFRKYVADNTRAIVQKIRGTAAPAVTTEAPADPPKAAEPAPAAPGKPAQPTKPRSSVKPPAGNVPAPTPGKDMKGRQRDNPMDLLPG